MGQGRGSLDREAVQKTASVPSATAAAEECLCFPVNLSSQPSSENRGTQMRSEALNMATSSERLNFDLEKAMRHISPSGQMAPPPSRPPKNKQSPLPPGAPSHRAGAGVNSLAANTHHIKHNHHHKSKNNDHHNNHQSLSPTSLATPSGGSATTTKFMCNQNTTTNPYTNNSQDVLHLSGPLDTLSSLYADLQRHVSTLDATSQMRDGEILKLTTAELATNNAIQSMRLDWKHLVAIMQGALSEHSGTLKQHTDSILFLENKLIDAENQSRKHKIEILRLRNEVESMSQQMI